MQFLRNMPQKMPEQQYLPRYKWHSTVGPGLSFLFVLRDEMPQRRYQISSRLAYYGTIHEL